MVMWGRDPTFAMTRRRLIPLLSAVDVALVVALWVRSYLRLETIAWIPAERSYSIFTARGDIGFMWWTKFVKGYHSGLYWLYLNNPASTQAGGTRIGSKAENADRGWVIRWGNQFERNNTGRPCGIIVFPFWLIAVCTGFPLFRSGITRIVRQRADRSGRCHHCGYDLRATPHRCPECGAVPSGQRIAT